MDKYWWTVWIKVAVLAVVLLVAYHYVSGFVKDTVQPYLLEESAVETTGPNDAQDDAQSGAANMVQKIFGKIDQTFGVHIDYENFVFDYANAYAQQMMKESDAEHHVISEPLS